MCINQTQQFYKIKVIIYQLTTIAHMSLTDKLLPQKRIISRNRFNLRKLGNPYMVPFLHYNRGKFFCSPSNRVCPAESLVLGQTGDISRFLRQNAVSADILTGGLGVNWFSPRIGTPNGVPMYLPMFRPLLVHLRAFSCTNRKQ